MFSSKKTSEKNKTRKEDNNGDDKKIMDTPVTNKADEISIENCTIVTTYIFVVSNYHQGDLFARNE